MGVKSGKAKGKYLLSVVMRKGKSMVKYLLYVVLRIGKATGISGMQ